MEHNYKLNFNADPAVYMDAESFMPKYKANIALEVLLDAQHDGRLWPQEFVDEQEHYLTEEILDKLKLRIAEFVKKSKPFSAHGPT